MEEMQIVDKGIEAIVRVDVRVESDVMALSITDAGKSLKIATLALRSSYTVNAPSIEEFTAFRNDLTIKANVYKDKVLPLATYSLQRVKDFMLYFNDLSFEDCLDIVDDIAREARDNQAWMVLNRDAHMAMSVEFKGLEDRIAVVLEKCKLEAELQEKKSKELAKQANNERNWAFGLAFIPIVGAIASPLLNASADHDRIESIAAAKEAELAVAGAIVIRDSLAGALSEYCIAMDRCAGEFDALASECETFVGQAGNLADTKKKAFYKLMNKRADVILHAVSTFRMVCVSAETDLQCLPRCPEPNYVRQWLASKRANEGPSFLQRMLRLWPEVHRSAPELAEE
jgi:hypothetical protein